MKMTISLALALSILLAIPALAQDKFVPREIQSDTYGDAIELIIIGTGDPVFDTYTLSDPDRIVVMLRNGELSDIPVKMEYAVPFTRVEFQYDYSSGRCLKLVAEYERADFRKAEKTENGIKLFFGPKIPADLYPANTRHIEKGWLNKKVSVDYENTSLETALSLLARQNGFDVVMSGLEDHEITARLDNVTLKDALNAILSVSGLTFFTAGDIVVIKKLADEAPGELVTKVFKLNFLDSRQIEKQLTNMLSSRGKLEVISSGQKLGEGTSDQYAASLIAVTDVAEIIPQVEAFITKIDQKPRQVAISVKLIETTIDDKEAFGIDWETNVTAKIGGAEGPTSSSNTVNNTTYSAVSTLPLKSGSFTYGMLTFSEVSSLIEFLRTSGDSRLLSSPSVTTTDGKPAVIDVVTTIPIQTVNRFSEGAVIQDVVTYQFKDVGITLDVTPVINNDGYITLKCKPTVEEITGWVGPSDNQQPITSKRSVNTDVLVKSGETLVIGGLMKESAIENINGVWPLYKVPVLGELFKHRTKQNAKTDLMILITPSIIP